MNTAAFRGMAAVKASVLRCIWCFLWCCVWHNRQHGVLPVMLVVKEVRDVTIMSVY